MPRKYLVVFTSDNFATTEKAIRSDIVTEMLLTAGLIHRQSWTSQCVMRTTLTPT
jgi:hypothetical protein|tara:strand:- start:22697 stop:22861 length:165 start_codon:yes stop_codon:yes gene_type:complete